MSNTSPGGGGVGHTASQLLKEMQRAQSDVQKDQATGKGSSSPFAHALEQAGQGAPGKELSGPTQQAMQGQAANLQQNQSREALIAQKLDRTTVGKTAQTKENRLMSMIEGLLRGQDKMSHIMSQAMSGQQFSPTELLTMQAGVYRFSQELDLTSKVVEKGTGGIKQTLNTQV